MAQTSSMSPVKLGFAVAWPAFWTGVPIKIVVSLLLLAMGTHPWEMPGLAFLLLLSTPVDIWAVGLSARTVFLERLRLEPPEGLGFSLWWQAVVLSAIYLPIAYLIESNVIVLTKAVAARLLNLLAGLPIAERITLELTLWSVPAGLVLILLIVGWLYLFGYIVRRQTALARPSDAPYQTLVRRWDLLRVPADQALVLTVVTVTGVFLTVLLWAFMPVTTPHPHQDYQKPLAKTGAPLKPTEVLTKTEKTIAQVEAAVDALEAKAQDHKGKSKAKDKSSSTPSKVQPVSATAPAHADDGHKH